MQDVAAASTFPHGTGSSQKPLPSFEPDNDDSGLMHRVGQAAMILSGVALVALAARKATGHRLVPEKLAQRASDAMAPSPIETSVTIDKPRAELYAFWRRLENLPQFMKNLEEVTDLGDDMSHWVGKSPLGFKVEWDAEIVDEREGHLLSWRSFPDSQIHNAGTVLFEDHPTGRGTVVRVSMELASANLVGQAVGKVLAPAAEQEVHEDLRRFKNLMETGEVPTTDGQSHGTRSLFGSRVKNPF